MFAREAIKKQVPEWVIRRTQENLDDYRMKKYQVIGGQYVFCRKGESDTLRGAKIIAGKNLEYWDNWQGWHRPNIYKAEDCIQGEPSQFNFSGIYPKAGAMPIC